MQKYSISIVSYLNSYPFLIGFENSDLINQINLHKDIPSVCARKLLSGQVDIGLVPVATLLKTKNYKIISDYCIGAKRKVKSVVLFSDVPLNEIKKVYLDFHSMTSVRLIKVLFKHYWKFSPEFVSTEPGYIKNIQEKSAGLVIGDRTFDMLGKFNFEYDLAEHWFNFTGLPFVFAAWVSTKKIHNDFIARLNKAFLYGINNLELSENKFKLEHPKNGFDSMDYLQNYVSYEFSNEKQKGMNLFIDYCKTIQ